MLALNYLTFLTRYSRTSLVRYSVTCKRNYGTRSAISIEI